MTQLLTSAAEAACDLLDTLRALYDAAGFGLESLDGLVEVTRRVAAGDFHPAVVWPIYAADTPDKPALVQGERCFTWRQANARINRLANALRSIGVESGDRIAIMLGNSIEWFEAMAGCQKVGASAVFVSYRYTAPEVRYLLENSGATVFLFDVEYASVVHEATAGLGFEQDRQVAVGPKEGSGFVPYEIFLALGSEDEPPAEWRRGGSRTILYTSGTTGKPKGAVRDLAKARLTELLGLLRRVPFRRSDHHLIAAPLYHATGSGFAAIHLSLGATLYILEKFDPIEFLATVDREKITTSALVPTMLRAILDEPAEERAKLDTSSLRMIVTTGSALAESLEIAARESFGDVLYDLYGSTEMGYVTVASPEDKRACPGTIGRPFPGVDVVLLDDHRRPVPDGEVGELFARSSLTVEGYHGNDAATRESRFGDYLSVGDLALRDSRGYLQLVGRKTDMVISGGMNVYPAEIESVLTAHPAIREAAVIGVPDEKWGEALVAFVVARKPAEIPATEELIAFCKRSLAGYKVPRRFERVDELPRNPTGKVLKRELRARLERTEPTPPTPNDPFPRSGRHDFKNPPRRVTMTRGGAPTDESVRMTGTTEDVTESRRTEEALRASEERYRMLADQSTDFIARHRMDGVMTYASPACRSLLGYEPEEMVGKSYFELFYPDDVEPVREKIRAAAAAEPGIATVSYRVRRHDDSYVWLETVLRVLHDPVTQVPSEVLTASRDISERKRVEGMRQDLVAMLSHDLKNFLTAVLGFAEILRDLPPDEPQRDEFLARIEANAHSALSLAMNFVDASQIQSGSLAPRLEPVFLNETIERVLRHQESRARVKQIRFEVHLDRSGPMALLDPRLIDRVVANLVNNAIKFSPTKSSVRVETAVQNGSVVVRVQDQGPGIPEDQRPKLFQRFNEIGSQRADSSGLGLFIVKTLVDAQGGTVGAEFPPEGGAVFEIAFPAGA